MRPEPVRVAIDLETTGLRPEQDAIIEIGAVKFVGARILDTFQSFVSAAAQLPYRIHRLTGITAADLRRAPPLGVLLPPLRAFIGSAPLVGHSVAFDAAFLRKVGLAHRNPLLDTYELASMLLPDLPSYTLASVADALQVPSSIHHRALADADLSRAVFLALLERLDALDTSTIEELAALPAPTTWTPSFLIKSQARERKEAIASSPFASLLATAQGAQHVGAGMSPSLLSMAVALETPPSVGAPSPATAPAPSPEAATTPQREPWVSLAAFMGEGGTLLMELERTEAALTKALAEVARASVAKPGGRVIIAASDGDEMKRVARLLLPRALALASLDASQVDVAELDEQEAYLCLHRWFGVAREDRGQPLTAEVARGLAKLTVWARDTSTGLRADVALSGAESDAWARVRSGPEFFDTSADCPYRVGGYCFVARGAQRAEEAAIVVTTHAALAAHLTGSDSSLPEATRTIILDGRQIEDELRRRKTFTLDAATTLALLDTLALTQAGEPDGGLLHVAATLAPQMGKQRGRAWCDAVERAHVAAYAVFGALRVVLQESQERNARGAGHRGDTFDGGTLRIDAAVRASRAWELLLREWAAFDEALDAVTGAISEAVDALVSAGGSATLTPRARGARSDLLATARRIDELKQRGADVLAGQRIENTVSWLRAPQTQQFQQGEPSRDRRNGQRNGSAAAVIAPTTGDETGEPLLPAEETATSAPQGIRDVLIAEAPTLFAAPTQVGALLAPLWADGRGMAALGWALSVGGDFELTRGALGLPETTRVVAATPDYSRQTLLCLPTDAPEPAAQSYHAQFEALVVSLARALEGDVVAIFPSHAALRAAAMGIRRTLERHDILTLAQGIDGSARQLWQSFYGQPRTVLLGAGAFWDGAEQRNRAPACVVVARTPFPPQSDPLVAARADVWADPQAQFMTPQAALKLRQALGGLAWSHTRRNAVVLFDRRLQTRSYGATILGALPQCELYQAPAADLAERIAEWTGDPGK